MNIGAKAYTVFCRVLNKIGCLMLVKLREDMNAHQAYRVQKLQHQLNTAQSYDEWKTVALKLDIESGKQEWKYDNSSNYFDAELLSYRHKLLKKYRLQHRVLDLVYLLREGLSHDIANIGHPLLFSSTYIGTKKLIEDYIEEVSNSLRFIASSECITFQRQEKIAFFEHCAKAYGQPVLMFSGGATLGLFHSGVVKALLEHDLMPKVLSGSSAGAIMTAMLGVSAPQDIPNILSGEHFFSEAFHFRQIKTILRERGGVADVLQLKKFLIENLGNVTFAEAFEKSGLHINIVIAPYDANQSPRIMNALTSPNLLVWSAVLASCAVPFLFPAVRLTSKRYDGEHTPYMANTRWVDGSVRSDFPQEKMARLYNINYSIACQVNPHVVPFMRSDEQRQRKDFMSWPARIFRTQAKAVALGMMDFTRERMGSIPPIRRILDHGYGIVGQRYYGDVNIIGAFSVRHYSYMLQNPRQYLFKLLQHEGERATWPKISAIATHARIGKTIQHCLQKLYDQERQQHPDAYYADI